MPEGGTAIIVVGGAPPDPRVRSCLPAGRVIAADSGLDHARTLGLGVDLVVGDLDSVSAGAIGAARAAGVPVHQHPVDKDATDTELALIAALTGRPRRIVLVSGEGDRLDHWLATLGVLGHRRMRAVETIEAWMGPAHVLVVHGPGECTITGRPDEIVTLLAMSDECCGVRTEGLRWALDDATLERGTSRGVSNQVVGGSARVSLDAGVLFVIAPDALGGGG
jgi:thiamine pyrophosphokinase